MFGGRRWKLKNGFGKSACKKVEAKKFIASE
jgi:hypothetical protein